MAKKPALRAADDCYSATGRFGAPSTLEERGARPPDRRNRKESAQEISYNTRKYIARNAIIITGQFLGGPGPEDPPDKTRDKELWPRRFHGEHACGTIAVKIKLAGLAGW